MSVSLHSTQVQNTIEKLYADAKNNDPRIRAGIDIGALDKKTPVERFAELQDVYLAIKKDFGTLLYTTARLAHATTVVEFGMSFGISTIFLACAVRDNGGGKVITTEFFEQKAARAKRNLADAGLEEYVEVRVGDALQTLRKDMPATIDFVFLDGAKELYLDVFKIVEPRLRIGSVIAADNTEQAKVSNYLDYIRSSQVRYVSSSLSTPDSQNLAAHEISLRVS